MSQIELIESDNDYIINLPDAIVFRCIVDYAFSIEMSLNNRSLVLSIETEFIINKNNTIHHLDIENKDSLIQGLLLIGKKVKRLEISHEGLAKVILESAQIIVKSHDEFEAWQVHTDDGMLIVCMPGGDLAIWESKDS